MEDVGLRPALPGEASSISALAMRSKAHWGYDEAFLTACKPDLTIDPAWCDGVRLLVAVRGGELLGYCRVSGVAPNGELDGLFVDPSAIGTGVGRELLRAAAMVARSLEMTRLGIDSDPGAEEFYQSDRDQSRTPLPSTCCARRPCRVPPDHQASRS